MNEQNCTRIIFQVINLKHMCMFRSSITIKAENDIVFMLANESLKKTTVKKKIVTA